MTEGEETATFGNFDFWASDVDGSNNIDWDWNAGAGEENIGDIGDVIAIRQRILNEKWQ